jgi:hypothetical protein
MMPSLLVFCSVAYVGSQIDVVHEGLGFIRGYPKAARLSQTCAVPLGKEAGDVAMMDRGSAP